MRRHLFLCIRCYAEYPSLYDRYDRVWLPVAVDQPCPHHARPTLWTAVGRAGQAAANQRRYVTRRNELKGNGMKVKLQVEFDVEPKYDADGFDENVARAAASQAVYDYLTFCTVSGENTDTDAVRVHVDGFGPCVVRRGEDHE
ncbi:hypothetical protein LCGC14_1622510 [marine sediment metagenome]|uniref:Uncharacterized protein n=1 Tax=marine sediment metagenome TaxID=412755 RepID=A0A0F9L4T7_9ZZZZ